MTEWRPVPSYPWLEASSDGYVRRIVVGGNGRKPGVIKGSLFSTGYYVIDLGGPARRKRVGIHQLVCEAFHGPRPEGAQVAHGDGIKTNNQPSNLRWATAKQNAADRRRHGRDTLGERHGMAKLSNPDIRAIRRLKSEGVPTQQIAMRFGLNRNTVNKIAAGTSWGHV